MSEKPNKNDKPTHEIGGHLFLVKDGSHFVWSDVLNMWQRLSRSAANKRLKELLDVQQGKL